MNTQIQAALVVRPARPDERPLIEGMAQLYIYDFSEFEPSGSDRIDLQPDGSFGPLPHMDSYWTAPDRAVLLFEVDGAPAGFALLNTFSRWDDGYVEHGMGEFFVMRKYRRQGIATAALHRLLALYPGEWEAAVIGPNLPAQAFWRRAIASAPGVHDIERRDGDGVHWTGPIWRFRV